MADPQVLSVWSPKGGVGKTTVAAAIALHLSSRVQTALVDGNADNPDLVPFLQCPGQPSVAEWPTSPERPLELMVRKSQNLWVLPGPPRFSEEAALSGPVMESIVGALKTAGLRVVLDLSSSLRDSTLAALDLADVILVPVTLDLLALTPVRRLERELEVLRLDPGKIRLVVNRASAGREITVSDIGEITGFPVVGLIPSARELAAAVNRGEAAAGLAVGTPVGAAVQKLVHSLFPVATTKSDGNGQKSLKAGLAARLRRSVG